MSRTIRIVGLLLLVVVIIITVYQLYFRNTKEDNRNSVAPSGAPEDKQMEASLEAIQRFNEKSNLGKYQLLASPPEGFNASISNVLGKESEYSEGEPYDNYYCEEFNGNVCVTHLTINSGKQTFFGIYVGDDLDKAKEIMQTEGYQLVNEKNSSIEYTMNYITFHFESNPDHKITSMYVSIVDPTVIKKEY